MTSLLFRLRAAWRAFLDLPSDDCERRLRAVRDELLAEARAVALDAVDEAENRPRRYLS